MCQTKESNKRAPGRVVIHIGPYQAIKKRLTTGKNEKEYSWHVTAIKFIGMKQLV